MRETSKATARRAKETDFPWSDILFSGKILDVGSGDDPLPEATPFNLPDGGGDDLTKFFPVASFDTIHASQVLEHALDPAAMLRSWIECVRPGGYIVATVPDWELYEKKTWPSKWNQGHRSSWSMESYGLDENHKLLETHHMLPEWLHQFRDRAELLLCRLVDSNYDHALGPEVDQTFDAEKGVECFIEFVLRKA